MRDQNELVHNQSALFQVHIHQADQNSKLYQEEVVRFAIRLSSRFDGTLADLCSLTLPSFRSLSSTCPTLAASLSTAPNRTQTTAEAELATEIAAQAGTRSEVEALQTDYTSLVTDTKEVEKATNDIVKQLAVLERVDVQLQEKKKSVAAKIKKGKKGLQDDTHAKSEAETWIRNHEETIGRVGKEVEKMDRALEKEEAELERITEGLKGASRAFPRSWSPSSLATCH